MKETEPTRSWLWGRLTFCGLMFLTTLRLVRLLRRRSLLYRWAGQEEPVQSGVEEPEHAGPVALAF